jgi:3-hydroxybutyryl-CoA dehydrogenase
VRLYARSAATRDAGVAFAREQLPAMLAKLPGSKAGTIVGVCDMAAALKDAWIIFESVPEDLELKKNIFKHDALSDSDAILASNSSPYASSAFADSVKNPAQEREDYLPARCSGRAILPAGKHPKRHSPRMSV